MLGKLAVGTLRWEAARFVERRVSRAVIAPAPPFASSLNTLRAGSAAATAFGHLRKPFLIDAIMFLPGTEIDEKKESQPNDHDDRGSQQ
jgi:hypothetical protein